MHSIRTKITAMTVCVIVIAMSIAAVLGVTAIRNVGNRDADRTLLLLCETGQKDLDYYFQSVEGSVKTAASYVETDLNGLDRIDDESLRAHVDRVSDIFQKLAYNTGGISCRESGDTFLLYCLHQDDYEQLMGEFLSDIFEEKEMEDIIHIRVGVFTDARQTADIEERFNRAMIAADKVKDDPQKRCGFYNL